MVGKLGVILAEVDSFGISNLVAPIQVSQGADSHFKTNGIVTGRLVFGSPVPTSC